jgi:hypothetical protein
MIIPILSALLSNKDGFNIHMFIKIMVNLMEGVSPIEYLNSLNIDTNNKVGNYI